jgi:hypothetical protein
MQLILRDAALQTSEQKRVWCVVLLSPPRHFRRFIWKDAFMLFKSRSLLIAAGLIAVPLAAAMAQNAPTTNPGSNRSVTASPGTADNKDASNLTTGDANAHSTMTNTYGGSNMNNATPGATGRTVVPGTTSSQASSAPSTMQEKTGVGTSGGGNK